MLRYEQDAWRQGFRRVAGVDEAGRGPWAGPVVAAAVFLDSELLVKEREGALASLTDSKQLSEKQREHFYDLLTGPLGAMVGIGCMGAREIDRLNILRATHVAMSMAVQSILPLPDFVLVDGRPVQGLPCPSHAIVKGDAKSLLIAAASVVAKVTRDRMMMDLDRVYPAYGFSRHKGYGTPEHAAALREQGASPCHRRSYRPVRDVIEGPGLFEGHS